MMFENHLLRLTLGGEAARLSIELRVPFSFRTIWLLGDEWNGRNASSRQLDED